MSLILNYYLKIYISISIMHHNDYWNYYYNNNGYVPLPNIRYVPIIDYPRPPHPPPPSFYYPPPEQHYYNSRYNFHRT